MQLRLHHGNNQQHQEECKQYLRTLKNIVESHPHTLQNRTLERDRLSFEDLEEGKNAEMVRETSFCLEVGGIQQFCDFQASMHYPSIRESYREPRTGNYQSYSLGWFPRHSGTIPQQTRQRSAPKWHGLIMELSDQGSYRSIMVLGYASSIIYQGRIPFLEETPARLRTVGVGLHRRRYSKEAEQQKEKECCEGDILGLQNGGSSIVGTTHDSQRLGGTNSNTCAGESSHSFPGARTFIS
ncbi:hypothetical protein C8R45DRAFT_923776 [Mycena sanguinolenta]|nr:hypothetical protein C8R45DRAFT_923776 [Mycena sanguinolenta]